MTIREQQEEREKTYLSKYATLSSGTKGYEYRNTSCEMRTSFQRDCHRIVHSKSFRRLKYKTQVFLMPDGDHFRTRLTHTLEVSQIARTLARALKLNEDLVEAIAMGHDLGHTPFGHAGEEILNRILKEKGGFEHNLHSLRIVEKLENDGKGLNLTYEVRDGIKEHKRSGKPQTLEGEIISYADRIAYLNHDIDDAVRAGILSEEDLPENVIQLLGNTNGQRIDRMIQDIIKNSFDKNFVAMTLPYQKAMEDLREFMFENVYTHSQAKREVGKAMGIIEALYKYFIRHSKKLPDHFLSRAQDEGIEMAVADYISMMTDRYAIHCYQELFIPKVWK